VTCKAATNFCSYNTWFKVEFIMNNDELSNIGIKLEVVALHDQPHRLTRLIHECCGDGKDDFVVVSSSVAQSGFAHASFVFAFAQRNVPSAAQFVNGALPHVVARLFVLFTGVTEPDDEPQHQ
jgi:hypothetical protein